MVKDNQNPKGKGKIKTAEVRFNLKSVTDKNKATLIIAVFRYDGKKLVYSTQHKIAPKVWSLRLQRPLSSYSLYKDVNNDLECIKNAIIEIYAGSKENPLPLNEFKKRLDMVLERVNEKTDLDAFKSDFKAYLSAYIEKIRNTKDQKERTAQKYLTLYNNLEVFQPGNLPFENIDNDFKTNFINWRYECTKASSQNTINKDIECIKNILKRSYKEKLHSNDIFLDEEFTVSRVSTSIFALNEMEVKKLNEFDFSDNKRLEQVRDWFLISCWSALRWSDFSTLNPEHIIQDGEDYYLNKFTEKTNTEVYIPVDERLLKMLSKYNFKSIDISNQKFNDYLKEVFEIVGITDLINVRQSVKGEMKNFSLRKCDIVSAHDGRRTWATLNFLKGFPIGLLMQVTGHKKEETFRVYVGASALEKARELKALQNTKSRKN